MNSINLNLDSSSFNSRNSRWDTRFGDIRQKLLSMTKSKNNISFIYRELLRSIIASFNDIGYFDSENNFKNIKVIHGSAERAIAKLKEENNIILPIISITQLTTVNDEKRSKQETLLINEKIWNNELQRAERVLSFAPRAVNIIYEVNVWTKYKSDLDQISEQLRLKFNPEMEISTKFATSTKAYLEEEQFYGSLEAADKEDRILKNKYKVTVRTYIPNPKFKVTSTGKIEQLKIEGSLEDNSNL